MIPFLLGTFFTLNRFGQFKPINFILFFISTILIDMTTTATNHYYDYKKAKHEDGYNYNIHNPINNYDLKTNTVILTILTMLTIAIISGLILFLRTDLIVLIIGIVSFIVGITYSFGPIPISRTPFGELFSSIFMGFVVFYLSVHIHLNIDSTLIKIIIKNYHIFLEIDLIELIIIFLVSLPVVLSVANIMLANNITDIEDDIKNERYTLPIYIGKEKSLILFKSLYYLSYINIFILIVFKIIPIISLIVLLTIIPVSKNIKVFLQKQSKKSTFKTSIENFLWINVTYLFSFIIYYIFA
jgi:1,4-dihydroxy-2-naphthoate octaprenyltransferase